MVSHRLLIFTLLYAVNPMSAPAQNRPWRLVVEQAHVLPSEIGNPAGLVALSGGQIGILDRSAPYVHILNIDGKLLRSFVSAGQGPGSASAPRSLGFDGTNIWIWDPGNGRLSYFALGGDLRREVTLRIEGSVYPLSSNRFLVAPVSAYDPSGDMIRRVSLRSVDSAGRVQSTVMSYADSGQSLVVPRSNGTTTVGAQPFRPRVVPMVTPVGRGFALAYPAIELKNGAPSFRLIRLGVAGNILFDGWVKVPAVRITSAHVDTAVLQLRPGPDSLDPKLPGKIRSALNIPTYLPAVFHGFLGPNNETWLREFTLNARAPQRWIVVDSRGVLIGRIQLPPNVRVGAPTPAGFLALGETENGEPTLHRYRVVR